MTLFAISVLAVLCIVLFIYVGGGDDGIVGATLAVSSLVLVLWALIYLGGKI